MLWCIFIAVFNSLKFCGGKENAYKLPDNFLEILRYNIAFAVVKVISCFVTVTSDLTQLFIIILSLLQ